jgi:hypothetical protein
MVKWSCTNGPQVAGLTREDCSAALVFDCVERHEKQVCQLSYLVFKVSNKDLSPGMAMISCPDVCRRVGWLQLRHAFEQCKKAHMKARILLDKLPGGRWSQSDRY